MTGDKPRYALFFTPPPGSPLERFGASVLGYDVYSGEAVPRPGWLEFDCDGLDALTAEPRRYGFHATLKAPFRLAAGCSPSMLVEAVRAFAASRPIVRVGRLETVPLGRFIALVPAAPALGLPPLAADCVTIFDRFRAALDRADRARRHRAGLTPRQAALLERWGYPYVLDDFRFHMTLAGPLPPEAQETWLGRLSSLFEPIAAADISIDALTLLRQEPGAPFRVVERFAFAGDRHGG